MASDSTGIAKKMLANCKVDYACSSPHRMVHTNNDSGRMIKEQSSGTVGSKPVSIFQFHQSESPEINSTPSEPIKNPLGMNIDMRQIVTIPFEDLPEESADSDDDGQNNDDSRIDSIYQDDKEQKILFEEFNGGVDFDQMEPTPQDIQRIKEF